MVHTQNTIFFLLRAHIVRICFIMRDKRGENILHHKSAATEAFLISCLNFPINFSKSSFPISLSIGEFLTHRFLDKKYFSNPQVPYSTGKILSC